jgi:hypothetical protein
VALVGISGARRRWRTTWGELYGEPASSRRLRL